MKHESTSSSGMLLGMAAGAALGAVGVMAATQNQRQLRRTTRKVMKGAENAVLQLDKNGWRLCGKAHGVIKAKNGVPVRNAVLCLKKLTCSRCTCGPRC